MNGAQNNGQKSVDPSAHAPNQVWSWDITYLPSIIKWLYYYLYLIMDIFSRKVVGWSVHSSELSEHAACLIKQACIDEQVSEGQLILHSDNGSPMKGASMLAMLYDLGVMSSYSRPSVSNDNPFSESLFKTLKYHTTFPEVSLFASIEHARAWSERFVVWYNCEHLHSGLKYITPEQRHTGQASTIMENRKQIYERAKKQHPARWSGNTRNWDLPTAVILNPSSQHQQLGLIERHATTGDVYPK